MVTLEDQLTIMSESEIHRTLNRIVQEILERNHGAIDLVLIGIQVGGVALATYMGDLIKDSEDEEVPIGTLDIGLYRDDHPNGGRPLLTSTKIPVIDGKVVVFVDDVLYTSRTIRAAMDALNDFGRPKGIQLAVLVDRGHRELPIRADYVGKNLPTTKGEIVEVRFSGIDDKGNIVLLKKEQQ